MTTQPYIPPGDVLAQENAPPGGPQGTVQVRPGEFVIGTSFGALSAEEQQRLRDVGIEQFNQEQAQKGKLYTSEAAYGSVSSATIAQEEPRAGSTTVLSGTGEVVATDVYNSLTPIQKALLNKVGIEKFNASASQTEKPTVNESPPAPPPEASLRIRRLSQISGIAEGTVQAALGLPDARLTPALTTLKNELLLSEKQDDQIIQTVATELSSGTTQVTPTAIKALLARDRADLNPQQRVLQDKAIALEQQAIHDYGAPSSFLNATGRVFNAATYLLPVVGTVRYGIDASSGGFSKNELAILIGSGALDALTVGTAGGVAAEAARGVGRESTLSQRLLAASTSLLHSASPVPLSRAEVSGIAKGAGVKSLMNVPETILSPRFIPVGAQEVAPSSLKVPIRSVEAKLGEETFVARSTKPGGVEGVGLRQASTEASLRGVQQAETDVAAVKIRQPSLARALGGAMGSSSTDLSALQGEVLAKVRGIDPDTGTATLKFIKSTDSVPAGFERVSPEEDALFMGTGTQQHFLGIGQEPTTEPGVVPPTSGTFYFTDTARKYGVDSGKIYAGTIEQEKVLRPGTPLPVPAQKLYTRIGGRRVELYLETKLSPSQIAKLKIGAIKENFDSILKPQISIKKSVNLANAAGDAKVYEKAAIEADRVGNIGLATDLRAKAAETRRLGRSAASVQTVVPSQHLRLAADRVQELEKVARNAGEAQKAEAAKGVAERLTSEADRQDAALERRVNQALRDAGPATGRLAGQPIRVIGLRVLDETPRVGAAREDVPSRRAAFQRADFTRTPERVSRDETPRADRAVAQRQTPDRTTPLREEAPRERSFTERVTPSRSPAERPPAGRVETPRVPTVPVPRPSRAPFPPRQSQIKRREESKAPVYRRIVRYRQGIVAVRFDRLTGKREYTREPYTQQDIKAGALRPKNTFKNVIQSPEIPRVPGFAQGIVSTNVSDKDISFRRRGSFATRRP